MNLISWKYHYLWENQWLSTYYVSSTWSIIFLQHLEVLRGRHGSTHHLQMRKLRTHEVKVRKQIRDRTRIQAQFCEAPESQDTFNHLTLKLFYDFYASFFLSGFLKFLIKVLVKSQRLIIHFKSFHNVPWQEKNSLSIDIVRGPLVCHLRLSPKQGDYLGAGLEKKKKWNIY